MEKELTTKRQRFSRNLAMLIDFALCLGYQVELAQVYVEATKPLPRPETLHYLGLAADLHLYRNGAYCREQKTYYKLALYWRYLYPQNHWGADLPGNGCMYHFQQSL